MALHARGVVEKVGSAVSFAMSELFWDQANCSFQPTPWTLNVCLEVQFCFYFGEEMLQPLLLRSGPISKVAQYIGQNTRDEPKNALYE